MKHRFRKICFAGFGRGQQQLGGPIVGSIPNRR